MELRYVQPRLGRLDELDAELLFATVFADERPPHGVAGLCDWRLGGRVARLLEEGFFSGALGDVLLVPGKPRTTFDKICFFGGGERSRFDEDTYVSIVRTMLRTMLDLRARGGVVELPGRHLGLLSPERAAEIALEEAAHHAADIDVWVLVEDPPAREVIEKLVFDQKRRRQRIEEPLDPP